MSPASPAASATTITASPNPVSAGEGVDYAKLRLELLKSWKPNLINKSNILPI